MMTETTPHYRDWIQHQFELRCARNRHYSLRAFARDLAISPASLSLILNGKQGLSGQTSLRLAQRLGFSEAEQKKFLDLIESQHARSPKARKLAQDRLQNTDPNALQVNTLDLDRFRLIADWYHLAILELAEMEGFQNDPAWIAKELQIAPKVAESAVRRLKRLKLLKKVKGKWIRTEGLIATPSQVPSDAIKKFHTQILKKAEDALYFQTVDQRDFSAVILPVAEADIQWAKEELKRFRRSFLKRLEKNKHKQKLYTLSLQFFALQTLGETQ